MQMNSWLALVLSRCPDACVARTAGKNGVAKVCRVTTAMQADMMELVLPPPPLFRLSHAQQSSLASRGSWPDYETFPPVAKDLESNIHEGSVMRFTPEPSTQFLAIKAFSRCTSRSLLSILLRVLSKDKYSKKTELKRFESKSMSVADWHTQDWSTSADNNRGQRFHLIPYSQMLPSTCSCLQCSLDKFIADTCPLCMNGTTV